MTVVWSLVKPHVSTGVDLLGDTVIILYIPHLLLLLLHYQKILVVIC